MGVHARSWQGWQIPIRADSAHGAARILEIDGALLIERFGEGQVAVIAGFQGIGPDNRIATLRTGRVGHQRGGDRCRRRRRPLRHLHRCRWRLHHRPAHRAEGAPAGQRFPSRKCWEMASLGAKVLQVRSVELAMVHGVRTFVRSSFEDPDAPGMGDFDNPPGTLICDEDEIVEQQVVTGIAYAKDEAQITLKARRGPTGRRRRHFRSTGRVRASMST